MSDLNTLDIAAVAWLIACWVGYTLYAERSAVTGNLLGVMRRRRIDWMMRMLQRENRMVDLQIVNGAVNTATFFASTSILILAGLFAVVAAPEKVIAVVTELPFTARATPVVWELKVVLMMLIFVHGFFKFAWAMRQFNYCSLLIGAAPVNPDPVEQYRDYAVAAARVASLAAKHFNHGMRAYYFGMAALSWFVHPAALIPAVLLVVLVLYRREFRSRTLRAIESCGDEP